ncbi:hypothetical protein Hte_003538 [Hypoxylon texense]
MPHATKKSARPRLPATLSTPQSHAYSWTATDAAKASRDGAFLTAWPRDEPYYTPPVHVLDQDYQGQAQSGQQQQQQPLQVQYYYSSSRNKSSTTTASGGTSSAK